MGQAGYTIADEPRPGALQRFAVNPLFPLLGLMLGGTYLGFAWFALNAFALGSSRAGRELGYAIAGAAGTTVLLFCLGILHSSELISLTTLRYVMQLVIIWKLGFGYLIHQSQQVAQELIELYGGELSSGITGVIALALLHGWIQGWVMESMPWLQIFFL